MHEFPETQESLIIQVKDPDNREAWIRFAQLYQPVIYRIALARGLQDADAHDLAQQVLIAVASAIDRWERLGEHSKFRHWLSRVTKNAILNALIRRPKDLAAGGSSVQRLLNDVTNRDPEAEDLIHQEYRREIYRRAAEIVQQDVSTSTWTMFERSFVNGVPIETVATDFAKSTGAVYTARSRVMYRLRKAVQELEQMEENDE